MSPHGSPHGETTTLGLQGCAIPAAPIRTSLDERIVLNHAVREVR